MIRRPSNRSGPALRLLLTACFLLVAAQFAFTQPNSCAVSWSPPLRLSNDSVLSISPEVAANGRFLHVLWYGLDTIGGIAGSGVNYCRSDDGGASFSPQLNIATGFDAFGPGAIAVSGDNVYITYPGASGITIGAILVRSTDRGATWEPPRLIRANVFPDLITALDTAVYIHFSSVQSHTFGMLGSGDRGSTWSARSVNAPSFRAMHAAPGAIHAVGEYDFGPVSGSHIETGYYASFDHGVSFFYQAASVEDAVPSTLPQLAVNENETVYVIWNDTGAVSIRRSLGFNDDGDVVWSPIVVLSDRRGAVFSDIVALGSYVSAAWDSDVEGGPGILFAPSNDGGHSFCPVDSPSVSSHGKEPALDIDTAGLHLVWMDEAGGNGEIYYRHGELTPDLRPKASLLKQNYPNPFNGQTRIGYDLAVPTYVQLRIYNILGETVATLVEGYQPAAHYEIPFNGSNLPSGVYIYRLKSWAFTETRKLIILR